VGVTLSREARKGLVVKLRYDNPVGAPVAAGQPLGSLEISAPNVTTFTVPLVAGREVPRAGMVGRVTGAMSYLIWGAS
jgi:D-alanyl-D-alanine carboxypeptidase (penicillin-binding protein 5/6)